MAERITRVAKPRLPVIDPATGLWGSPRPFRLLPIREAPGPYKGVRDER